MIRKIAKSTGRELKDGSWRKCFDNAAGWAERIRNSPPVTVVVPVYKCPDLLDRLLVSLEAASSVDGVILVDDHSPDRSTMDLCRKWAGRSASRTVIRNAWNRGFAASVNAGISAAPAGDDILVLNSDTVVSRHAVERLKKAAYSRPGVATVTPVSNAAGIFSLPRPKENNAIPAGWSVAFFADFLLFAAGAPYEIVPAGSGFCLYMTRRAIEDVGLFDQFLFERGYGEDTDFCRRAAGKGFVNLADMSTFVFHEREASFGLEKKRLKCRNAGILKAVDPLYLEDSLAWEKNTELVKLSSGVIELLEGRDESLCESMFNGNLTTKIIVDKSGSKEKEAFDTEKERIIKIEKTYNSLFLDFFGINKIALKLKENNIDDIVQYLKVKWNASL
jgi:GT2 family glycosyltransferase